MPRRDGTGPLGQGALTGRGFGFCSTKKAEREGAYGFGAGLRRRECRRALSRELLTVQKAALESRLEEINSQLDK